MTASLSVRPLVRLHNRATNVKALTLSSYCQSLQSYIAPGRYGQLSAVKTGYPLTSVTGQVKGSCTEMYLGLRCRLIEVTGLF